MASSNTLTTLLQKATIDDHEEILKACNATLKKSKSDTDALRIRAVAYLKLDRFEDALKAFEDGGDTVQSGAEIPYAYALYKCGQLDKAAKVAASISADHGARHLEAQALYRAESALQASQIYAELVEQRRAEEQLDLRVNIGAVDAQLQWSGSTSGVRNVRPAREDMENFETAYNAACGSLARGELGQAEVLLKRSSELCKHSEELSEEEKASELLPITAQHVYVLLRTGKTETAAKVLADINIDLISDPSTRLIAQNNKAVLSTCTNPFLQHKTYSKKPPISAADEPFTFQSTILDFNAKTLDLQAFKRGAAAASSLTTKSGVHPTVSPTVNTLSTLHAATYAHDESTKAAIKKVSSVLEKSPKDVGLIVTLTQMYILEGDMTSAITLLQSFFARLEASDTPVDQDVRFAPGLVSLLVSLYSRQRRKTHMKQELATAAVYWRNKSKSKDVSVSQPLLTAAGTALLQSSDESDLKEAGDIFALLRKQNTDSKIALAGYVASHAASDPTSVSQDAGKLTPVKDLIKDVDIDALERAGIPQSSNALAIAQQVNKRKRKAVGDEASTKRKVRKSRLPKHFEEGKTAAPDPERWVPLRDRSTYKPRKGKKGKRGQGEDKTQGGIVAEDVGVKTEIGVGGGGAGGSSSKKNKKNEREKVK